MNAIVRALTNAHCIDPYAVRRRRSGQREIRCAGIDDPMPKAEGKSLPKRRSPEGRPSGSRAAGVSWLTDPPRKRRFWRVPALKKSARMIETLTMWPLKNGRTCDSKPAQRKAIKASPVCSCALPCGGSIPEGLTPIGVEAKFSAILEEYLACGRVTDRFGSTLKLRHSCLPSVVTI